MGWRMSRSTAVTLLLVLFLLGVGVPSPPARADPNIVNGVDIVVDIYVNGSEVFVLAILNFTSPPMPTLPDPSQVDNVQFSWYAPNGTWAYNESVDPDPFGFAISNYTPSVAGTWRVNASYSTNLSQFDNVSFEVLPEVWGAGTHYRSGTIEVGRTATLSILPGADVRFAPGAKLNVRGRILAQGSSASPVMLRSNLTTPGLLEWEGVRLTNTSSPDSMLDYVHVSDAARGLSLEQVTVNITHGNFTHNQIGVRTATSTSAITDSDFSGNNEGIEHYRSYATDQRNRFVGNQIGVKLLGTSGDRIADSLFQANTVAGVWADGATNFVLADLVLTANTIGLRLDNANGTAEHLTFSGGDHGVLAAGSTTFVLGNSTITAANVASLLLRDSASVVTIAVAMAGTSPSVTNPSTAVLTIRNYLDLRTVSYENASALANVSVRVFDDGVLAADATTNATGAVPTLLVTDRVYQPTPREHTTRILLELPGFGFEENNVSTWDLSAPRALVFRGSPVDTDADGIVDFVDPDDDNDGLSDAQEAQFSTNPLLEDTDGDGMPDGWEVSQGLDPVDGLDAFADREPDGLTNREEYWNGTDPSRSDSDVDGMPDGWEVLFAFEPLNVTDGPLDADGDGATNLAEYLARTNPRDPLSCPGCGTVGRTGSLRVTVRSINGTVLGHATVVVFPGTTYVTDAEGNLTISGLTPGVFDVSASLPGYFTKTRNSVGVRADETTGLLFLLPVNPEDNTTPPTDGRPSSILAWISTLVVIIIVIAILFFYVRRERKERAYRERLRARRKREAAKSEQAPMSVEERRPPPG